MKTKQLLTFIGLLFFIPNSQVMALGTCNLEDTNVEVGDSLSETIWNNEWNDIKKCADERLKKDGSDNMTGTLNINEGLNVDGKTLRVNSSNNKVSMGEAGAAISDLTNIPALGRLHLFIRNPQVLGTNNQLLIGSTGFEGNRAQIGLGWTNGPITYAPSVIGYITTNEDNNTFGDLYFATRNTTDDTQPIERMRIAGDGDITMNGRLHLITGTGGIPLSDIASGIQRAAIGLRIEKSGPSFLEFSNPNDETAGIFFSGSSFAKGQIAFEDDISTMSFSTGQDVFKISDGGDSLTLRKFGNASPSFNLIKVSTNGPDVKFRVRGDGNTFSTTGQMFEEDYAEYFCGTIDDVDIRIGVTVSLVGEKIRGAKPGDEKIIGVVRPKNASAIIGGTDWNNSQKKYLYDDYGASVYENVQFVTWQEENDNGLITTEVYRTDLIPSGVIIPEDAEYFKETAQKLNPDYDPNEPFVPRSERPECYVVGLLGKVPITKGQPVATNWIKMRDISDEVELWLIK